MLQPEKKKRGGGIWKPMLTGRIPAGPSTIRPRARCPQCGTLMSGWNARLRCALHYVRDCRGSLADPTIRAFVDRFLGRMELRQNQRNLLRYAASARFFAVDD